MSTDRDEHDGGSFFALDTGLLPGIVEGVLHRRGATQWTVEQGEFWCSVRPRGHRSGEQGWKLHLSATPLSAALVLAVAADVLVEERASFKFAGALDRVALLTGGRADRGGGGKFITVYPDDPELFRRLARRLHAATLGLRGPRILSDRPYAPGSLVHYRYGVFGGVRTTTNDGDTDVRLRNPGGGLEKDRRQAWVTTPAWAPPPFPEPAASPEPTASPETMPGPSQEQEKEREKEKEKEPTGPRKRTPGSKSVRLNGRYVVTKAIRHAFKGGVYRATDETTGRQVVVKEARAHVGVRMDGTDLQDTLRHEAETLEALAPLGFTPAAIEVFAQGGNLFLAQEFVPGRTLRDRLVEHPVRDLAEFLALGRQIVDIVAAVHGTGRVLRDLSPNNLMVTPEGRVRLIDVEYLAPEGVPVRRGYTPGYVGPEVSSLRDYDFTAPTYAGDLYGLGAVLLHLATGVDMLLVPDDRPIGDRTQALITAAVADHAWAAPLLPLLLALCAPLPEERWELPRVRKALAELPGSGHRPTGGGSGRNGETGGTRVTGPGATGGSGVPALSGEERERLIADGIAYLLRTRPGSGGHLWDVSAFGATTDPLNVQYGSAGVLAVLTRAAAAGAGPDVRRGVAELTEWTRRRLAGLPTGRTPDGTLLPGLHFGRSGTAWALLDAAQLLGDEDVAAEASALARAVPVDWPNRDICHGAAGAGMTQLHFWRTTGDPVFRDRAVACADAIIAAAEDHPAGVIWPVPAAFDSNLAGARHYGFAHGIAGIGAFLLAAGVAAEHEGLLWAAGRAGDTLVNLARFEHGRAVWPAGDRDADGPVGQTHWCSGSSGIGTFLVRLWARTGDERHREAAVQAAAGVREAMWLSSPAACHGLAGNAEFLLDMSAALDDPRYRDRAGELAACIHTRAVRRDGLLVVPDESLEAVTGGYQTGVAGTVGMLLRLRDGGPRLWMPDTPELFAPADRHPRTAVGVR
ncbi:class IV lanthionine synthetase LanL [Streptomyces sp. 43Y-GA-1]|uniref:class IV lanthionine synthetase LanL n=1 Tax=Streptomyces sp. 43Y-GA-1 TaxID=2939435 RepID=UPI0020BDA034|nr:class IV lanthionine synthetase LanL [Streptomyces sp. 43Y-GA-1]MCL6293007.1 class IV lanthionine synthetase LanL [Streptomyces sp. 43Y-GA-1]